MVCSCTDLSGYVDLEKYNSKLSELEEANSINNSNSIEILRLEKEVDTLNNDLGLTEEELLKYKRLINNLNQLLSNVYYGYASNESWILDGFTGFSLKYNDKYYLITVGHAIEDENGRYYNHRFKANFSNEWIYPKLLVYENDYYNDIDYAILYSNKINSGLNYDLNNSYPSFVIGNTKYNIFKRFTAYNLIPGESGSPIIDIDGEVIDIATGGFTDIDLVLEAIDNLN